MNSPKIVCPNNPSLLNSFTGRTVAVRVKNARQAVEAAVRVQESGNRLFCVIVESKSPLAEVEFPEDLQGIPLALMVPAFGKFRHLAGRLDRLRDLNLRVYLPCDRPENFAGLRILSSVGIHSCAVWDTGLKDWEALTDLMTYAVLERVPHAPIEPFAFIASNYKPFSYLKWGSFHFDDPQHFLHLDAKVRVALSQAELRQKRFIAPSLSQIAAPEEFPAIRERAEAWRQFFVDNHPCASCGGWKICLGKFAAGVPNRKGCAAFFLEMLEVARQYQAQKSEAEEYHIWQP